MNEDSGGTPNPLNPNPGPDNSSEALDANPSEPMSHGGSSVDGMVNKPRTSGATESTHVMVEATRPGDSIVMTSGETAVEGAGPKKKKTGLIVAIIVCFLVAVGCGVAAFLLIFNKPGDPVTQALQKLMRGETPTNIAINGDIDVSMDDSSSPFSNVKISLDTKMVANPSINSSDLKIAFTQSGVESSFQASEIYTASGDLFLKVEGISDLFNRSEPTGLDNNDTDENVDIESSQLPMVKDDDLIMSAFGAIFEVIEGQWIRISADELSAISGSGSLDMMEGPLTCIVNMSNGVSGNSNSIAEVYNKHPFIVSSTENMSVVSRRDPIYKLGIDSEAFTEYIQAMQSNEVVKDLYSCIGWDEDDELTSEDVASVVEKLPDIYVEINNDHDFTRLYLKMEPEAPSTKCDHSTAAMCIENGPSGSVVIDFTFSYPATVNISEPNEYTDLSELFGGMYDSDYDYDYDIDDEIIEGEIVE